VTPRLGPWFAIALVAALSACALAVGSKGPTSTDRNGPFVLSFEASAPSYAANEPVIAVAQLGYDGPETVAHLSGSGSGPILFDIEQLDGDLDQSAFQDDDCKPHDLPAGQPVEIAFRKSGAFDPASPRANFWRDYFKEPDLRLPAGHYRLTAHVELSIGSGCTNEPLDLRASLVIDVR
jgi:hypothetical protein